MASRAVEPIEGEIARLEAELGELRERVYWAQRELMALKERQEDDGK